MKKILLLISVLAVHQLSSAQDMWGVSNSNFAGSAGMNLNPASMLLTPYCWEATLLTVNVSAENNYIGLVKNKMNAMQNGKPDAVQDKITNTYYNNDAKTASFHFMLQLPSLIYKTDNWAFAFRPLARTDLSVRNVPKEISQLSYLGLKRANLDGSNIDLSGLKVGALALMQYGLSIGKPLSINDDRVVLGAASINFLNAYEAAYTKINSGNMSIPDDSTVSLNHLSGTAAHAISQDNFPLLRCNGIGTDIGIEYISKPGRVKYANGKEKPSKKYNYRVGISLVDVGFVKFNNASDFNFTDASVTYMNPAGLKATGIKGADSLIQASVGVAPTSQFMMALPTSLSVQFDKALSPRFYFNVSAVQRMPLPMPQLSRPNSVSIAFRYETPFFEASLPYSFYDYYRHRIGFAMRYRFVFVGTDKLSTFVGQSDITGLDVYFGIKLSNFDFLKRTTRLCCKSFF